MTFACNVENSLRGQPWRWRRNGGDDLGVPLIDQLLLARGVAAEDLARHRQPTIRDFLPDPSLFKDMDKAAARLADAVEKQEAVTIFGDYDVDGATSAALLVLLLRRLGLEPGTYIPDDVCRHKGPAAWCRVGPDPPDGSVRTGRTKFWGRSQRGLHGMP